MNDLIFNVQPQAGGLLGQPWDAFLPPFLGVLVAFGINYAAQLGKNRADKIKYINMIRSEIELCFEGLKQDRIRILPVDRWTSALNSGALRLFDVDKEIEPLTKAYNHIQNYNHDSTWCFAFDWWSGARKEDEVSQEQIKDRDLLLNELERLKNEEWLKAKSWWQFWK
jgi:hypothetical protein